MAQQIVLTVTDDGWWGWICATHGEAAFLHKTKRRAAIEAAIHNERHAFHEASTEEWLENLEVH